jgi:hypothetical protein
MNILSFIALEYIGAGEFTICAQLKILSTAGVYDDDDDGDDVLYE